MYDAVRTLESFATTLHAELDLTQLSQRLVVAVEETIHPAGVSLWLSVRETPGEYLRYRRWERAARVSAGAPAAPGIAQLPDTSAQGDATFGDAVASGQYVLATLRRGEEPV